MCEKETNPNYHIEYWDYNPYIYIFFVDFMALWETFGASLR